MFGTLKRAAQADGPTVETQMTSEAIVAMALSNAPQSRLARHPRLRKLFLFGFLLRTLLLYLLFWTLQYSLRRNRPRRHWTLQRCLRVRFSRSLCQLVAICEIDDLGRDLSADMDPSKLEYSHPVTIPPAPTSCLRGYVAERLAEIHDSRGRWIPHLMHRVDPQARGAWGLWNPELVSAMEGEEKGKRYGFEPVKAFWFQGKKATPAEPRKPILPGQSVMLHFHGGGYLCGTAAETDLTSSICKRLASPSPVDHILSVDYRLAPTAPWPLPLLDAISAYHYLVHDEGVAEKDIILVGDSAGGHLALALARYLRDEGKESGLAGPKALVLMSPWVDVGFSNAWDEEGRNHNASSDVIDDSFGPFATSLLTRALPATAMHHDPYLSPAGLLISPASTGPNSFESLPPTYIIYGEAERISNSILTLWSRLQLARKAEALQGQRQSIKDRITGYDDAVHDFMIFPWMKVEADKAYEDLNVWLNELLAAPMVDSSSSGNPAAIRMSREGSNDTAAETASASGDEGTLVDWTDIVKEDKRA